MTEKELLINHCYRIMWLWPDGVDAGETILLALGVDADLIAEAKRRLMDAALRHLQKLSEQFH